MIDHPFTTIYVAHPDYLQELCTELGDEFTIIGNLIFSAFKKTDICFALDVWLEPKLEHIDSIKDAIRLLRSQGKFWYLNPVENVRRSRLIEAELRKLPELIHHFPLLNELPTIGAFSLLDKNAIVYTSKRWKKSPLGYYPFIEDKTNPPNRAYLKLWEALSLWDNYPKAGETAIDLGASPGGWTYVMQSLGVKVTAVDKAPLQEKIAHLKNVSFRKESAFALKPQQFSHPVDWLLCDVACYPDRTYDLISAWIESGMAKNFIFTIKLQGETDFQALEKFQQIKGCRVIHLYHNKHEVTFFYPAPQHLFPFPHSN
jgi:23S rRNA (cytidine2498-2'-O)-methyltransferase